MAFDLRSTFRDESGLSVGQLCQLALLRSIAGEDGESLASQILPLSPFPSLWARENEYCKTEAQSSINLLLRAFGKTPFYDESTPATLSSLESNLPAFRDSHTTSSMAQLFHFNGKVQSAFVNRGENVSLGAMRSSSIEIPAFGPQVSPLNDPKMFGVHRTDSKWSAISAEKEIWFDYECSDSGFKTNFIGITSEVSVYFVFYVKAELAIIGNDIFAPKSLKRYHHASQKVTFHSSQDRLTIENRIPTEMQLIPLAGSGCFWDSDYLIAYAVPSHDSKAVFQFS